MLKYSDFLLESLITESALVLSDKLKNLLEAMPENRIKNILLDLYSQKKDLPFVQNYLDLTGNKEELSFIQDRRAQQILADDTNIKYATSESANSKYLHHRKNEEGEYINRAIFTKLNYTPTTDDKPVIPPHGQVGLILGETVSTTSGKTFCLFEWEDGNGTKNQIVLNKVVLFPKDERLTRIWSQGRNPIRLGRIFRALLSTAHETATDKEIEDFVNLYKSTWDIINDAFLKFDVVSGDSIAYWYNAEHYESMDSTLGNSCMAEVESSFFEIYTSNPDKCQLVILYSDDGRLVDGKWKSDTIKGRALLWKTDQGDMFMDRIYYIEDSLIDLFKQYAERNGWWCKRNQNSESSFFAVKGMESKRPQYSVKLNNIECEYYPYVDTLTYANFEENIISNDHTYIDAQQTLDSTGGYYDSL
jgi:hypothetical protein